MMKRDECFRVLARHVAEDVVVATYSSAFDWIAVRKHPLNYLSVGAMGLASSHGLGLALGRPDRRIIVLDGDGSLLMNLGTLVTIAEAKPRNLFHFICENGNYEANWGGVSKEDNSVLFTPAGVFVEQVVAMKVAALPAGVTDYVRAHYAGAKITEAGKVTDAQGRTRYEAEVKGKDLLFDAKGNFIKKD